MASVGTHGARSTINQASKTPLRLSEGLWRNIRMKGIDLTPETDRLHVVLSKDYETAALVLCLALGPTTAGPSNISQARTMAWPSTEIDLSRDSPIAQKNSYSPSIYIHLQPYNTTTRNYNNHNSRYSNAHLIIPIFFKQQHFLIQHQQPTRQLSQYACLHLRLRLRCFCLRRWR